MRHTPIVIERIPASRLAEGARLLAGAGDDRTAGDRLVAAARAHGVELDELWGGASGPGQPYRAVALLAQAPGATRMAYTSPVRTPGDREVVAAVLDAACRGVRSGKLAQSLLEPGDAHARAAFESAGFFSVGDLLYLRRRWADPGQPGPAPTDGGLGVEPWRTGQEHDLAVALARSYEHTLDCPELCGLREIDDVIESHKATGRFDPALWWLLRWRGRPAGAILLNPVPAQGHTELVYLGLEPDLRGRGVARWALRVGLSNLAGRPHRTVMCAVDARNAPARALYERTGFTEFARRSAMVRPIPSPAPTAL